MELFYSPYPSLKTQLLWCCIYVILFCGLELQQQAHGCLESERDGLLRVKAQFNHPNGSSLPSWDVDVNLDCCQWEHVSCDPFTYRVTGISLYSRTRLFNRTGLSVNSTRPLYITGPRPWSLNASIFLPFDEFQVLSLDHCQLEGLEELPRLGKLEVLDLPSNWYIKTMPPVHLLPSLKILNLYSNQLSDWDELAEVTALKNLEVLNLASNLFSGNLPSFIGDLTSLKSLSFGGSYIGSKINGSFPEVLCKLKNLEELDLSSNQIEGYFPSCFAELTSLRVLDLHENNLKGNVPASLFARLNSLEYVSLSSNSFEGSFSFSSLANNPNLEIFELINNNNILEIETESPLGWIPLFQLKRLRLTNCPLNKPTGTVPSFLLTQNQLTVINLENTGIEGNVLNWLFGNNTSLESISLSNNSLHGTLDLNPNSRNPHLRLLDVSSNHISGELPLLIGSVMPNLEYLNMSRNALRGPIPHSIGEMRHLITLDLSNNYLSGEVPASLAMNCSDLKYLKLDNNSFQGRFPPLTSNLKSLSALHLDNNNITGFTEGVLRSTELSFLNISQNALSGRIPNWIGKLRSLSTLILSKNFLEGPVPISICHMSRLEYLDLSYN